MAEIRKKKLDLSAFKSDIGAEEFASELDALPEIHDLLRLAGLQDGAALAAVRARSAERAELRAKALKNPGEEAAAVVMKQRSRALAKAFDIERARVTPEEAELGKVEPETGSFRLVGKVISQRGVPQPGLTVVLTGEKSDTSASAKTDKGGVFDLTLPVGEEKGQAVVGENLFYRVLSGRKQLAQSKEPAATVSKGDVVRLRIVLPRTAAQPKRPVGPIRKNT